MKFINKTPSELKVDEIIILGQRSYHVGKITSQGDKFIIHYTNYGQTYWLVHFP